MTNQARRIGYAGESKEEEYRKHLGREVRVHTPNNSYHGVYIGIEDGDLLLLPQLIREDMPYDLDPDNNGRIKSTPCVRIERKVAGPVKLAAIEAIENLSDGYLERFARALNRVGRKMRNSKSGSKQKSSQ